MATSVDGGTISNTLDISSSTTTTKEAGIDFNEMASIYRRDPVGDKRQSWLQGRLALSKQACRFELPMDMKKLENMTVAEYLENYTVISSRRQSLYSKVYNKYKDKYGKMTRKDLEKAIAEVLINTINAEQSKKYLELTGVDSMEKTEPISVKLFAGICAFLERVLYPQFVTDDTQELAQHQKERIERADFHGLQWKLQNIQLSSEMKLMLESISDYKDEEDGDIN